MFLELVATITAGVGAAGLLLVLRKTTRGRLGAWVVPAGAGIAMLSFTIWSEYSWFARTAETLPDGVTVAWANEESVFYRPWTYAFPQTNRFLAVDAGNARTHPDLPEQRMVDLYLMGRWSPNRRVTAVFDCQDNRRADIVDGVEIGPDGAVEGAAWVAMAPDDPVLTAACMRRTG